MISPWIRARLDCDESIKTGVVGQAPAGAREVGFERCVMVVDRIQIAPRRVGLPDLDESVADGLPIAVKDAPSDDDPFAKRVAPMLAREVCILRPYRNAPKHRSGCPVKPLVRQSHRLAPRSAQLGGAIRGIKVGRLVVDVAHGLDENYEPGQTQIVGTRSISAAL